MNPQPQKNQIWKRKDCDERVKIMNVADTLLFVRTLPTVPKNKRIAKRDLFEKYELEDQIEVVKEVSVDDQLAKQLAEAEQRGDVINLIDDDDNNNNDGGSSSSNKKQPKRKRGVGSWRNDKADRTERVLMVSKITMILLQRDIHSNGIRTSNLKFFISKFDEWFEEGLQKVPKMALHLDNLLYASASSKTEYLNDSTLKDRLRQTAMNITIRNRKRQKTKLYDEDLPSLMDNLKM